MSHFKTVPSSWLSVLLLSCLPFTSAEERSPYRAHDLERPRPPW